MSTSPQTLDGLTLHMLGTPFQGPQGEQGPSGKDGENGKDGIDGTDGQSAYELWLALGNQGTEQDFLDSQKGETGAGLTNRHEWVGGRLYNPGDYVFALGSSSASSMWFLRLDEPYVSFLPPNEDMDSWSEFEAPAGADGKSVQLQKTETHIQWRQTGGDWTDLISIEELKGDTQPLATLEESKEAIRGDVANTPLGTKEFLEQYGVSALVVAPVEDLNNVVVGSFFSWDNDTLNKPLDSLGGKGISMSTNEGYTTQLGIEDGSDILYVRHQENGVWSPEWKPLGTEWSSINNIPAFGTSATADVVESSSDDTLGRVLTVGTAGLLTPALPGSPALTMAGGVAAAFIVGAKYRLLCKRVSGDSVPRRVSGMILFGNRNSSHTRATGIGHIDISVPTGNLTLGSSVFSYLYGREYASGTDSVDLVRLTYEGEEWYALRSERGGGSSALNDIKFYGYADDPTFPSVPESDVSNVTAVTTTVIYNINGKRVLTTDDFGYESGTWTPTVFGSGNAGSYEFGTVRAHYQLAGKEVRLFAHIPINSITAPGSGQIVIGGIPFNKRNNVASGGSVRLQGITLDSNVVDVVPELRAISQAYDQIYLKVTNRDGAIDSGVSITSLTAGSLIILSFSYLIN